MNYSEMKKPESYSKALTTIVALTAVFSLLSVIFSDVFVPFTMGFVALLFLYDQTKHRLLSVGVSVLLLIGFWLANPAFCVYAAEILLVGALLVFGYRKGISKTELSLYITLIISVGTLLSLYVAGALKIESLSIPLVMEYYEEMFHELKEAFLAGLNKQLAEYPIEGVTAADFREIGENMITMIFNLVLSFVVILSFLYTGICMKLFTAVTVRVSKMPRAAADWQFELSSLFAYFYLALFFLSVFVSTDSVIGIAIANLYYIFLSVFAYLGAKYALHALTRTRSRGASLAILIVMLLLFSALAVQVLSLNGIFVTIMRNRMKNRGGGASSNDGSSHS